MYKTINEVPCQKGVIKITDEKASELLNRELRSSVAAVNNYMKEYGIPLTQYEFDALVIWFYNLGNARLKNNQGCRLAKVLRGEKGLADQEIDEETVKEAFTTWCLCAGSPLEGLVKRRLVEANIFLYGYKNNSTNPTDYYTQEDLDFYYQVKDEEKTNPALNPSVYENIKQNVPVEPLKVVVYDSNNKEVKDGDTLNGEYTVVISNVPSAYQHSIIIQLQNIDTGKAYTRYATKKTANEFSVTFNTSLMQKSSYKLSAFALSESGWNDDYRSYGYLNFNTENDAIYGFKLNDNWVVSGETVRLTVEEAKEIEISPFIINNLDYAGGYIFHPINFFHKFSCTISGIYDVNGNTILTNHVIKDIPEGKYQVTLSVNTGDKCEFTLIVSDKIKYLDQVFLQTDSKWGSIYYGWSWASDEHGNDIVYEAINTKDFREKFTYDVDGNTNISAYIDSAKTSEKKSGTYYYDINGNSVVVKRNIYNSGCGLLSFVNAVYSLTGNFIEPSDLAKYSIKSGYRPFNNGTAPGLYKAYTSAEQLNITVGNQESRPTNNEEVDKWYQTLAEHLKNGGTAVGNFPGHFMAIIDYDEKEGFLIYDSYPSSARGGKGVSKYWLSKAGLNKGKNHLQYYILISK